MSEDHQQKGDSGFRKEALRRGGLARRMVSHRDCCEMGNDCGCEGVAPRVIKTEAENNAALAIVEKLMEKGDDGRTPEEEAALELLTMLIGQFEAEAYPIPVGDPPGALRFLMESNNLKAADLVNELGSRAKVSEILSGKRSISKEQAKRLAERFKLSPAVFI